MNTNKTTPIEKGWLLVISGIVPYITALAIWISLMYMPAIVEFIFMVLQYVLFGLTGYMLYKKGSCKLKTTALACALPFLGALIGSFSNVIPESFVPDIISYVSDLLPAPLFAVQNLGITISTMLISAINFVLLAGAFYVGCAIKERKTKA